MATLALFSCSPNRYEVDLNGIEYHVKLVRYENEFLNLKDEGFEGKYEELLADYPLITAVMVEQVIQAGRVNEPRFGVLKKFFLDTNLQKVVSDIGNQFKDLSSLENELSSAFKYVKYYYPNEELPEKAYTVFSAFRVPGFTYENTLAISLDWYMGKGYEYYNSQVFPLYMQRRMSHEYITPQVLKAYFTNKYPMEEHTDETLLSEMIYWGKQLEFTKMMMPNLHDSLIIEYTSANLKWCKENEGMMYQHFVDGNLWYETEQNKTYRYVSDGPYTVAANVPIESAPRMGWYVGWQIVRNYLDNEKGNPVEILFENDNYQDIFRKARYKP